LRYEAARTNVGCTQQGTSMCLASDSEDVDAVTLLAAKHATAALGMISHSATNGNFDLYICPFCIVTPSLQPIPSSAKSVDRSFDREVN